MREFPKVPDQKIVDPEQPMSNFKAECRETKTSLTCVIKNVAADQALLTHIFDRNFFVETARDAKRMAKEVWVNFANSYFFLPESFMLEIEEAIKGCMKLGENVRPKD